MTVIGCVISGEPTDGKWKVKFAYDESLRPDRIPADKFKAEVKHVELVLYGTKTRHVNPSKSSPNLAKLKKEESLEKEAIQEQFEYDKKTNSLIGETIGMSQQKKVAHNVPT